MKLQSTRGVGGVLSALALALALSACNSATFSTAPTAEMTPTDYRKRHPIAIREADRSVEIFVGTNRGGLTPAQRADVTAFATAWRKEATGGIMIEVPAGTPNERAAADVTREVRAIFAATGMPPHAVSVRPYQPSDPEQLATLKINYARIAADAGPCGLWPHDLGPSLERNYNENKPYWNLGCASQRNLAAMVENPADLVQPRGEAPNYPPRRTTVLEKYRQGQNPAGQYPSSDSAKLSDVGK